jgi:hypothetical protein
LTTASQADQLAHNSKEELIMIVSTHNEYLNHLHQQLVPRLDEPDIKASMESYAYEFVTLTELSLDPQREALKALYCPTGQGAPKDPLCMLRSWLLMNLIHETSSPDAWAKRLKREPLLAILAGFEPGQTPCATTHRDFIVRLADGPYALRSQQDLTLSQTLSGMHTRRLSDTTKARQAEAESQGVSQSKALCDRLLEQAETPRDPQALQTRLEDLFVQLGLRPSIEAGLFGDEATQLVVEGDGTPLQTAASPRGTRTCDCPPGSKECEHPRNYTSPTAQWCYHPHRGFVFGDETYTISAHVNGHDIPLMTIMGTGNESDFTLSPRALDELLKVIEEHDLPLNIDIFIGDGHHDAMPFYRYCRVKGIRTVIPINGDTANDGSKAPVHPHLEAYPDVLFDTDGTPLCPGGCRMRHEHYHKDKEAHFYTCPMKRRNGKGEWIFYATQCPKHNDCCPDKALGYSLYLKVEASPRYLPEIPRCAPRFKTLFKERTGVERSNRLEDHYRLDRCTRHAVYGLIRLTMVNVAKHARLRWLERATRPAAERQILQEVITRLLD